METKSTYQNIFLKISYYLDANESERKALKSKNGLSFQKMGNNSNTQHFTIHHSGFSFFCHKAAITSRALQQFQHASRWHRAYYLHVTKALRLTPKTLTCITLDFYTAQKRRWVFLNPGHCYLLKYIEELG